MAKRSEMTKKHIEKFFADAGHVVAKHARTTNDQPSVQLTCGTTVNLNMTHFPTEFGKRKHMANHLVASARRRGNSVQAG